MPLITGEFIEKAYHADECKVFIPYGPLGIGKTTYACKVVAQIYGTKGNPNWEAVKSRMVFHPREFVEKTEALMESGKKDYVLIWDDAGLWLNSLEHWNPFVRSIVKYLNVMRTNLAGLILTSPMPTWVIKKVRGFPQAVTLRITRTRDDTKRRKRYRVAKAYRYWVIPDMKKSGVRIIYEDYFTALMPNDFYDWYKPIRDSYAQKAIRNMREELRNVRFKDDL